MYLKGLACACDGGLAGLSSADEGDYENMAIDAIGAYYGIPAGTMTGGSSKGGSGAPSGGAAGSAGATRITTTTDVNTQVSPQISPSFVQQSNPTNSPVTTGAYQTLPVMPGVPITGAMPGFDMPTYPHPRYVQSSGFNYNYLLYGSVALLAVALFAKYRKGAPANRKLPTVR